MQVKLLEGLFAQSQRIGASYLRELDIDRLAAPCYEAAGQTPKKPHYGGWEAMQIAGHSIGHWLSAASSMYAATGDEELLGKVDYAVSELARVQSFDGEGYVSGFPRTCFDKVFTGDFEVHNFGLGGSWVPWYSIHKIFAGLLDAYALTGNQTALDVVVRLANWAKRGTDRLSDALFQRMLICEHGGMNEAMADLYLLTKDRAYLDLAIRFCHQAVLDPLSREIDELEGKHANTQIPKVVGAAKLYEITGMPKYRRMAEFFWKEVTANRSYVIGGNSIHEHFGPKGSEKLGVETAETCNTYNMLKLTEHLYRWSRDPAYIDYYERALYNHILASQDPDSGMKMYFISTEPGHFKVYGTPDESFWCCTGTGMENPARYTRMIYAHDRDDLYVNLFIASEVHVPDRNWRWKQLTDFPRENRTRLVVEKAGTGAWTVHVRIPGWLQGPVKVSINGEACEPRIEGGYVTLKRAWAAGDMVEIELPMGLHLYTAKDDPNTVSFLYGPVVLAGALGRENFPDSDIQADHRKLHHYPLIEVPILVADKNEIQRWVRPAGDSPLRYETDAVGMPGHVPVTLIPFYELHHQRYTLYWKLMDRAGYRSHEDRERKALESWKAATVDVVYPHEQQSEVDHGVQMKNAQSGYSVQDRKGWRQVLGEGFFRYTVAVEPDVPLSLEVTYSGGDRAFDANGITYAREFDILLDGVPFAKEKLEAAQPGRLYAVRYDIPPERTKGKRKVDVAFASEAGKAAGRVFAVRIVRK